MGFTQTLEHTDGLHTLNIFLTVTVACGSSSKEKRVCLQTGEDFVKAFLNLFKDFCFSCRNTRSLQYQVSLSLSCFPFFFFRSFDLGNRRLIVIAEDISS